MVQIKDKEYTAHCVFDFLRKTVELYDHLSTSCMFWCAQGTSGIIHYDAYVYLSMKGTLESIDFLLKSGKISDTVTLLRKYFDDILVDIYITTKLKDNYRLDNLLPEEANSWLNKKHRIPSLKKLLQTIKTSPSTIDIYPLFGWKSNLNEIRSYLDDFVHSNRYGNILINCADILVEGRLTQLNNIHYSLKEITRLHLAFMFHLNSEFFMASNYIDSIDCGTTPPSGCEKWISPWAQEAFDFFIKSNNTLALFIKQHSFLEIE